MSVEKIGAISLNQADKTKKYRPEQTFASYVNSFAQRLQSGDPCYIGNCLNGSNNTAAVQN